MLLPLQITITGRIALFAIEWNWTGTGEILLLVALSEVIELLVLLELGITLLLLLFVVIILALLELLSVTAVDSINGLI